jgi:hypothetical protein
MVHFSQWSAVLSRRECTMVTKTPQTPPLFKVDTATLAFSANAQSHLGDFLPASG